MEQLHTPPNLTARRLTQVLADFKILGDVTAVQNGPTVTMYEFEAARGTKISKLVALESDIARCMGVTSARVTLIPGNTAIGIELPNIDRETVSLMALFASDEWLNSTASLPIILGKDMVGQTVVVDLATMPHLLMAGTTGSGKSIGMHSMIASLLYRYTSDQCRLILIDPKMLEMTQYAGLPHLLTPVITDPTKAVTALKWTLTEMERRYRIMSQLNVRNIIDFNTYVTHAEDASLAQCETYYDNTGQRHHNYSNLPLEAMPYIVVVIDEVADLMMVAGPEIEYTVQRLSQMARAAGIHLIMATQRPSVNIITGSIKANFPSRITFRLQGKIDSRTIIGQPGAEQLIGNGDMLFMSGANLTRIQGAYANTADIQRLIDFRCQQQDAAYIEEITEDDMVD
jgi:S-DNA-T family DNA segregation ATPase FtsK/SpoIIIE